MHDRATLVSPGRGRGLALWIVLCGGASWASCTSTGEPPARSPVVHAASSEELERIMLRMQRADSELLPQELDVQAEEERRREELAALAGTIAQSADGIIAVLDDVALSGDHRAEFERLARELEDRAERLREAAAGSSTAEIEIRLVAMRESCTACHTRFRVLPALR